MLIVQNKIDFSNNSKIIYNNKFMIQVKKQWLMMKSILASKSFVFKNKNKDINSIYQINSIQMIKKFIMIWKNRG